MMRTVLSFVGVALGSVLGTVGLFVLYAVISDARSSGKVRMPFSYLLGQVERGHVDEITVHGRIYVAKERVDERRTLTFEAVGPPASEADLLTLRPSDPKLPAPRVVAP